MRLTGGLHLTDEEKMCLDKNLENKIINFEKDSRIDYARFNVAILGFDAVAQLRFSVA